MSLAEIENNNLFTFIFLCLAVLRIYLEIVGFNFSSLPMTKAMMSEQAGQKFHKTGLYFCIGYIILFAPGYLLS